MFSRQCSPHRLQVIVVCLSLLVTEESLPCFLLCDGDCFRARDRTLLLTVVAASVIVGAWQCHDDRGLSIFLAVGALRSQGQGHPLVVFVVLVVVVIVIVAMAYRDPSAGLLLLLLLPAL